MLPAFDRIGNLPSGIHFAEWGEFVLRYSGTARRRGVIKNERQYRITKAQAARFEAALREVSARNAASNAISILDRAQENALRSQWAELQSELTDYEDLKSGTVKTFRAQTFDEIPTALIRARIATGMSQRDLAIKLGIKEQQVQRYEATEYAAASFDRIRSIIRVLGINVREEISLGGRNV